MMAGFILAGRIQAAIFVLVSTLVSLVFPPLVIYNNAAIALITLRKGWQQGIIYSLIAAATLVFISIYSKQSINGAFLAGLIAWLPIVLMASVLATTDSWSKVLQLILFISLIGVFSFHLLHPDTNVFWEQLLEPLKTQLKESYAELTNIDEIIDQAVQSMTGTFVALLALLMILSLIIARNWQALLFNPGGFGKEFRQIRIGKQASIGFLIGIAIAISSDNQLINDLVIVATTIFMFQGLSLIHALVKINKMSTGWLVVLYILLFILFKPMFVLLAIIGSIDNFIDYRNRTRKNKI